DERADHASHIHAAVLAEAFVLDREKRVGDMGRKLVERYDVVFDWREIGELFTSAIEQYGRAARLIPGESLDPGTPADTAAMPEYRDDRPEDDVGNEEMARTDAARAGNRPRTHALQPRA